VINRQVENLVRLVSDMLDLGRIAQHKLALRPRQIDLSGLIDAAIETALPHLDKYKTELVIRLPDEPVSFTGDAERLVQAISSLVINSATYPAPGGRIELRARRVAGDLEITVTDNGVAALPELQRSAAETLAQYQDGLRFTAGAGIGLALVKDLVQMHGGTVGPGENGTVSIRLPISGPLNAPTDSLSRVESAA
jgi:signal transduction histidine kinase